MKINFFVSEEEKHQILWETCFAADIRSSVLCVRFIRGEIYISVFFSLLKSTSLKPEVILCDQILSDVTVL